MYIVQFIIVLDPFPHVWLLEDFLRKAAQYSAHAWIQGGKLRLVSDPSLSKLPRSSATLWQKVRKLPRSSVTLWPKVRKLPRSSATLWQ